MATRAFGEVGEEFRNNTHLMQNCCTLRLTCEIRVLPRGAVIDGVTTVTGV